jgi:hypothetical protein
MLSTSQLTNQPILVTEALVGISIRKRLRLIKWGRGFTNADVRLVIEADYTVKQCLL